MPAVSVLSSRARTLLVALLVALLATPLAAAVQPTPAHASTFGERVVSEASRHYGKPYSWGATGPSSFDCSGFVGYVYRQFGVSLPRTSRDQYAAIPHVSQSSKAVGDLIFTYDSGGIYHVGIYAGSNKMWAATKSGDIVRPQTIWTSSYVVGRPPGGGPAGAIGALWERYGAEDGFLGDPLNEEYSVRGGRKVDFEGGDVYWSAATHAHEVHGSIRGLYDSAGGASSAMGLPTSDEHSVRGGRANTFANGAVYWSTSYGSRSVQGSIWAKHDSLGGPDSVLGLPTRSEASTPGGRVSRFRGGEIYWSSSTGSHEVHGAILGTYWELGGSGGKLGLPVTDERDAKGGRESVFQGGTLRWSSTTGKVRLIAS